MIKRYARHLLGEKAETLAYRTLRSQGLRLIEKNYRCKLGEIDLIFEDKNTLVFIEVRARSSTKYLDPFDSIDEIKQRKLQRTAEFFLINNPKYADYTCRFDAISIDFSESKPSIKWLKNAF